MLGSLAARAPSVSGFRVPKISSSPRLGLIVRISALLIAGATVGIGSARWVIARSASAVPISGGDWKIWLEGSNRNPYGMAHFLLRGRLPPAARQMSIYETERDDGGAPLDGSCSYSLSLPAQGVRWWDIAILDPSSGPVFNDKGQMSAISSAQAIGSSGDILTVTIAREPTPGNWISPGGLSYFGLAVTLRRARLHDAIEPAEALPRISKGPCS